MRIVRRLANIVVMLLICNSVLLWALPVFPGVRTILYLLLTFAFLWINVSPANGKDLPGRLRRLNNGCELLLLSSICGAVQLFVCLWLGLQSVTVFSTAALVATLVISLIVCYGFSINGASRIFLSSTQMALWHRVAFFVLWLVPVVNTVVFMSVYGVANRERNLLLAKLYRNRKRIAQQVCATRYPVLLVHGIFFRDWGPLNYWGRIPKELEENGAVLHYGQQQSSAAIEVNAGQLKERILQITTETGCEKVNIIAHSKGGLDARYAVSCLGAGPYVASLTTVNTPHRGCRFAKRALDGVPAGIVSSVSKNYNKIYKMLGDDQPDFFSGVSELTDVRCAELNALMPDDPEVLYQSIGSCMRRSRSAIFPLNLGYRIVSATDGENDGLVAVRSMPWGSFTMLQPRGRKGISHADLIDLTRKDINGFDVCEFYVGLLQGLKEQGL